MRKKQVNGIENMKKAQGISLELVAPQVGFEPTTLRLTAGCSTAELLRKN